MLRPQRNVELVVVCDCGADPDYLFGDLANLIRLARIDHQLEIRVNADVVKNAALLGTFGTPESFRRGADGQLPKPGRQCAILLDVMSSEDPAKAIARIIVLKPVLLDNISADVSNYGAKNPLFPQDSTSDQFFNEEQWESYRKLGLEMVKRIFPQGCDERYAKAFWQAVAVD